MTLETVAALASFLVDHGYPAHELPGALLGPRPSRLWEAIAARKEVTIWMGEYRWLGDEAPPNRWIHRRDFEVQSTIFEELFIRSFVMRISEVWESDRDFRDVPLAHYTLKSLCVTTVIFTLGHVFWEWWVCVPWVVLSSLWFYRRKSLSSVMLVHGVTNGALLALAIWGGELFTNEDGSAFSFWFFV